MYLPVAFNEPVKNEFSLSWVLACVLTLAAMPMLRAASVPPSKGRAPVVVPADAAVKVTTILNARFIDFHSPVREGSADIALLSYAMPQE